MRTVYVGRGVWPVVFLRVIQDVGSVKAGQLRGIQLSKDHLAVTERQRISKVCYFACLAAGYCGGPRDPVVPCM